MSYNKTFNWKHAYIFIIKECSLLYIFAIYIYLSKNIFYIHEIVFYLVHNLLNRVTLLSYSSLCSLFSSLIWQNSPLGIYLMLAPVCAAEHLKRTELRGFSIRMPCIMKLRKLSLRRSHLSKHGGWTISQLACSQAYVKAPKYRPIQPANRYQRLL